MSLLLSLTRTAGAATPVDSVGESTVEAKRPEILRVAGAAQFVEGRVQKTESTGPVSALTFKSAIYENDKIDAAAGSTLKIASRAGCLIITRSEAQLTAPVEGKPWRIKAKSLRLICRPNTSQIPSQNTPQIFSVNEQSVIVRDGEVLINSTTEGSNLLPLRGSVSVNRQPLDVRKLYAWVQGAPKEVSSDESDLRALNESEKPPRESAAWPAPPKPSNVRLMFGPFFTRERVYYDNADLEKAGLKGDGPRIQLHVRTKNNHSFIVSLSTGEANSLNQDGGSYGTPEGAWPRTQHTLLEFGERKYHDRWWSPYYRIGGGFDKLDLSIARMSLGRYSYMKYTFYVLSAAYGVDAHFAPRFLGGLGLYGGLEGFIVQSLWRAESQNANVGSSTALEEPWRSTHLGVSANAGIEYNF